MLGKYILLFQHKITIYKLKNKMNRIYALISLLILLICNNINANSLYIVSNNNNDLYLALKSNNIYVKHYNTPEEAILNAEKNSGIIITALNYPYKAMDIGENIYQQARKKHLRLYIEFINRYKNIITDTIPYRGSLERGVISSNFFLPTLKEMDLIGLNDCYLYKANVKQALISYAKVAGFDKASYGLTETHVYPLLFKDNDILIACSSLTNFRTSRNGPIESWKNMWSKILIWLTGNNNIKLKNWESDTTPSYTKDEPLPTNARKLSIKRGTEWLFNGRFLVHPSWKETVNKYQGDGTEPFGPPVEENKLIGNGLDGILEGHASKIYYDGSEQYRYWLRNDVQGEVSFLLAAAGKLLNSKKYACTSEHLMDYMFYESKFRKGAKSNPDSASYGLLGWSDTHPYVFYNDDNARSLLGVIGASAFLENERWNKFIVECILANYRTSSKQGFQGGCLEEPDILKNGWEYYYNRDFTNPHPHFESWMWACYLWLYDKTKFTPLLEKAKTAIKITMEAYPENWHWTNGIQQERARMILPLAWLVRVDDTPEHRMWLDKIVKKLLENQVENGAIREELGSSQTGFLGKIKSNKEYGLGEAPLIFENGDPVSDMLYTCNFAFFSLNEAAKVTHIKEYENAVKKLSDFLIRIQVKSDKHKDLDGAWMRAFDYNRWDYWASNADLGWGAWSTLTGWIQSWIVGTQTLVEENKSFWELTKNINVEKQMNDALWMLKEKQ